MSIIGEGKHINFYNTDLTPSWQKMERYEYCESLHSDRETNYWKLFCNFLKMVAGVE